MELVQEIGSYAGFAAVVGLAVLAGLYFSQARDVKRLREWAGSGPQPAVDTDPELAARAATAPAQGAVTPKPAVPRPAGPATAAGKPAPAAAAAGAKPATAAGKKAPPVPGAPATAAPATGKQPAPATAQGAAVTAGKAPDGAATQASGTTATPAKPGTGKPPAGKAPAGATTPATGAGPPRIPRPGAPGSPPTLPPRRPGQTRIVPPYQSSQAPAKKSRLGGLLAQPRYLVLVILGVLVVGGGVAYGALQLTSDDQPASEQAGSGGGGDGDGNDGGKGAPVDPSTVTVSVLNGTTIPGLAAQVGDEIERKGFQLGNVTNSAEQGARAESVVLFAPGSEREARSVGRRLKISQREPISPESQALGGDATVVVVVGADQTQ